jgi:outer membrane biogenesis lipoprotein LolB
VEENVVKGVVSIMLVLLLAGCSETVSRRRKSAARAYYAANHAQYGAALQGSGGYRYNTQTQLVDVNHFEQFQASYELSGRTGKNERFICSFDPDGQFLHLSMR